MKLCGHSIWHYGITFILALCVGAGCSQNPSEQTDTSSSQPTSLPHTSASQQIPSSQTPLVIWHFMTDRVKVLDRFAEEYKKLTGITVKFELYAPSEVYTQKVRAAAQTNTLPDIFSVLGEKRELASFVKAGYILNLTDAMQANNAEWEKMLFPVAIKMDMFEKDNSYGVPAGYYGAPIDMMNIQFIYNKKLFQKAGLDPEKPPRTWQEFIDTGKALRKAGIQGLVSGWSEIWMIDCLASNFAYNIMGEQKIVNTIRGEVPYTDPDWIRVFSLFDEMRNADMYASGIVSMVNKRAELIFANEHAAIAFNGSWCVNVYHEMNPQLDYAAMFIPKVSDKYPLSIWGGAGVHFMVNARSARQQEALEFLKWLTQTPQQVVWAIETRNMPANKEAVSQIPAILRGFADDMDNINHPRFLSVNEDPAVIEAFDKGIQSIIIGEKTPEQAAKDIQAVKEQAMKKVT